MESDRPLVLDVCEDDNSQAERLGNSGEKPIDLTNENVNVRMAERSQTMATETESKGKLQAKNRIKARKLVFSEEDLDKRRHTANLQERSRMKKMSEALDRLRTVLPDDFKIHNRKMSKIRTIRVAVNYIKALGDMIKTHDAMMFSGSNAGTPLEHFQIPSMPHAQNSFPYLPNPFVPLQYPDPNVREQTLQTDQLSTNCYPSSPMPSSSTPRQVSFPFGHPYYETPPQMVPGNNTDTMSCFNTPGFIPTPVNGRLNYPPSYPKHMGLSMLKKYKSSTISTPIIEEGRNVNELNASFLNSSGDDVHEACRRRKNPTEKYNVGMDGIYPLPEEVSVPLHAIN